MALKRDEMETIIRAAADDKEWEVWSDDKKVVNKLKKLGWKGVPFQWRAGETFVLPLKALSFRTRKAVENPKSRGGGGLNKVKGKK